MSSKVFEITDTEETKRLGERDGVVQVIPKSCSTSFGDAFMEAIKCAVQIDADVAVNPVDQKVFLIPDSFDAGADAVHMIKESSNQGYTYAIGYLKDKGEELNLKQRFEWEAVPNPDDPENSKIIQSVGAEPGDPNTGIKLENGMFDDLFKSPAPEV